MNNTKLVISSWRRFAIAIIKENKDDEHFLFSKWADFLADFTEQYLLLEKLRKIAKIKKVLRSFK